MNQNLLLKAQVSEIQTKLETEKTWWENRRASIQSDFMKELETDGKPPAAAAGAGGGGGGGGAGAAVPGHLGGRRPGR
jgi:hypothetical protein